MKTTTTVDVLPLAILGEATHNGLDLFVLRCLRLDEEVLPFLYQHSFVKKMIRSVGRALRALLKLLWYKIDFNPSLIGSQGPSGFI
jgi:hypothetical protein